MDRNSKMTQPTTPARNMPGGFTEPKPATPEVQRIADQVRPEVEKRVGSIDEYVVEQYRTQVVAGTNYAMKVRVGSGKFVHLKVYQPLGNATPQLTGLGKGKTDTDPMDNIPNIEKP